MLQEAGKFMSTYLHDQQDPIGNERRDSGAAAKAGEGQVQGHYPAGCNIQVDLVMHEQTGKEGHTVLRWDTRIQERMRLPNGLFEAKQTWRPGKRPGLPYHQIFLDLSKAFHTINRERLLRIMQAYGEIFCTCWDGVFVAQSRWSLWATGANW
jgi:hypothetical protein